MDALIHVVEHGVDSVEFVARTKRQNLANGGECGENRGVRPHFGHSALDATIPLTQGYRALVSIEDYERVSAHKWQVRHVPGTDYAQGSLPVVNGRRMTLLHRFILNIEDPEMLVDHANCNGLDCRRQNLRICTRAQNLANRKRGRVGAYLNIQSGQWYAKICINGKQTRLGNFSTKEEARQAYARAFVQHFGEFARLDPINGEQPYA